MKFLLKDIEQIIDDEVIEKAELLLQSGNAIPLSEIEKNLWITAFNLASNYEIEVQVVGKKVQAYTCDCGEYGGNIFCEHLAASFLGIRKLIREKEEEKKQAPPPFVSPKRLTTSVILKEVSFADLRDFVKDFAKSNRQFAIALKTRFASSISAMNREEKYTQLLATAIKGVKRPNRGINAQGIKQIAKLLEELQSQVLDTTDLKNFQEAFAMLQAIFQKVPEVLRITEGEKDKLLEILKENFPLLEDLINAQPAPLLEIEIWEFILESFSNGYLKLYEIDRYFLRIAKLRATTSVRIQNLIHAINFRLSDSLLSDDDLDFLLVNKLDLLNASNQQELAAKLIQENLNQPLLLLKALQLGGDRGDLKQVEKLAKIGLKLNNSKEVVEQLEEILFRNAILQKKKAAIIKWGKKRFMTTYDQAYWSAIKDNAKSKWEEHKKETIKLISENPYSVEQRDILSWIYSSEKDFPALLNFMKETRSIELLIQNDQVLPAEYKNQIEQLYKAIIIEYLNQHLGRAAAQKIKGILAHLKSIENIELLNTLRIKIQSTFPDRQSLLEEMADI